MTRFGIIRKGHSLAVASEYCKYNARLKLYPTPDGDYLPSELMVSNTHIFNPDGVEYAFGKSPKLFDCGHYDCLEVFKIQDNKLRSLRRAKCKVYDYIRCNLDLSYFVTLTFNGELVARDDYNSVCKKINIWLDNRVRRNNLKYVGVVERHHQSNGLHYHLIVNDCLNFVDSGTVKCLGRKKPIKIATADRYKIPLDDRKTVYNIGDWAFGFSTAIPITNDNNRIKTAHYMCKYLTKDFEKIGGRYYISGGNLLTPKFEYFNKDFNNTVQSYDFSVCGIEYKVVKFD